MPYAPSQGARIYYEETAKGAPILFIHEFGGDHRSWEDQVRYFGRGWRCITWCARGYPPSDCPEDEKLYGQDFFSRDAPVLLLVGDEDEPCLDVNLWMKRLMPTARLALLPGAGHAINFEEPALFNQLTEQFLGEVSRGSWRPRDARATPLLRK